MNAPSPAFIERTRLRDTIPGPRKVIRAERVPGSVSLEELERLSAAPLSALVIEHSELNNWLDLPNAELWADQYLAKSARLKAIWQTIRRRFPEYAARGGKL